MSFFIFQQDNQSFESCFLYDADPEWKIHPTRGQDHFGLEIKTDEGEGHSFIIKQSVPMWGVILRRDDSPYNDCLPPSEQLLTDALKEEETVTDSVNQLQSLAGDGFFNPFNAIMGNPLENEIVVLKQSFQSNVRDLSPGYHQLSDYQEPDRTSSSLLDELEQVPDVHEFQSLTKNLESPDGMRNPAGAVHATIDNDQWTIQYTTRIKENGEWEKEEIPLQTSSNVN